MNVEFEDNQREMLYAQIEESNKPKGLIGYLLNKGFAKDEKQAGNIMNVGALVIIAVTAYVIFTFVI